MRMMAKFSEWNQRNVDHRDFQHSDRYEDWEDVKHRRKPNKTVCKRNNGKPHDYVKIVKHYSWSNFAWYEIECSKCGKKTWRVP